MTPTVRIALYRGDLSRSLMDKLVMFKQWFTIKNILFKYTHVEFLYNGSCFSSSLRDKGIRVKDIDVYDGDWDFITLNEFNYNQLLLALDTFERNHGNGYDIKGILLSQLIPLNIDSKKRMFCSELIATMLTRKSNKTSSYLTLEKSCNNYDPARLITELITQHDLIIHDKNFKIVKIDKKPSFWEFVKNIF